jgi:outer membrane lipoprotein-sorting protein
MRTTRQLILCAALLASGVPAGAQQNELGWTMDSAVKQLDRQGSDMESVLAEVSLDYGASADTAGKVKSGRIYVSKDGKVRINATDPAGLVMLLEGRTVHYYNETLARVDEYSLSKHPNRMEQFIPLGFGTTGRDFERDYLVTFLGEDRIGDRRVLGLELTPKDDDLRAIVSKIQIYVDQASWLQIMSRGNESLTIDYSGTARNLALNSDLFKDDWPRGTQKVRK